ncbi:class E sortase [Streptomyces sp. NPDC001985]|uniref:class E sortase n=1 Tax=Streptomyces sp. NPDC001985 TaxID=3154406 RepID=UPI00332A8746
MSLRLVVRVLSELCVTVGTLIVLFVAYVMFWTGIKAADASDGELDRLQERWSRGRVEAPAAVPPPGPAPDSPAPGTTAAPAPAPAPSAPRKPAPAPKPPETAREPAPTGAPGPGPAYRDGRSFAVMYIPRFGRDWDWPVLEGTRTATLKRGLGHYAGTAPLGGTGNFAVAGHRRTYGDPFKDFPRLRPGDPVVLTDGTTWFTYRIARKPLKTVPTDIGVINPVPEKSGFSRPGRYLTLTTCEPEWGSSHRLIAWARLDSTRPVTDGRPPAFHS